MADHYRVTGTLTPDATGIYTESGEYEGKPLYIRGENEYYLFWLTDNNWRIGAEPGFPAWLQDVPDETPVGDYSPIPDPEVEGTATVDHVCLVTASAGDGGIISPTGETAVVYGADQSFTATPAAGYQVNQWLVDGEVVHVGGLVHTLTNITADHTLSVTFSAISHHLCTLADVKTRLGLGSSTDFDDVIQQIIDDIDGAFDSYTGRKLLVTDSDVTEYYTAEPKWNRLLLRRYPVVSITSIKEASDYDFAAATALVVNTDYRLVNQGLNGVIYRVYEYWLTDEDAIQFVYRAGYCGAGESPGEGEYALPDDLREAAIMQTSFIFKRKDDIGLSSVSAQGGSISKFADVELLPMVKQVLDKYKRPSL